MQKLGTELQLPFLGISSKVQHVPQCDPSLFLDCTTAAQAMTSFQYCLGFLPQPQQSVCFCLPCAVLLYMGQRLKSYRSTVTYLHVTKLCSQQRPRMEYHLNISSTTGLGMESISLGELLFRLRASAVASTRVRRLVMLDA